jgi:hypothetical protein
LTWRETFNALARVAAFSFAAAAAAPPFAASWRGGFALRDGRSAGGSEAGETNAHHERAPIAMIRVVCA